MTTKEYFEQIKVLNQRIERDIEETDQLRELMTSISSPKFGGRVKSSQSNNASFVKSVERVEKMEKQIDSEVDLLVDLKTQVKQVIDAISSEGARKVLTEQYVLGHTWDEIKDKLNISETTVWRWYNTGLEQAVLPEDAIII